MTAPLWWSTAISWSWLTDGMLLQLSTNSPTHLLCYWTMTPPVKIPFYRWQRGVRRLCGFTWKLLNTIAFPQLQAGFQEDKTFAVFPWPPCNRAWWFFEGHLPSGPSPSTSIIYTDHFPGPADMPIAAHIHRVGALTIPQGINTPIPMTVTDFDLGNMVDLVAFPTRITFPIAGIYHIVGYLQFGFAGTHYFDCSIYLNGITQIAEDTTGLNAHNPVARAHSAITWLFAAGDFIELVGNTGKPGGVALQILPPYNPSLSAVRIAGPP